MSLSMELRGFVCFNVQFNTLQITAPVNVFPAVRTVPITSLIGKAECASVFVLKQILPDSMQTIKREHVFQTVRKPSMEVGWLTGIQLSEFACQFALICNILTHLLETVWQFVHGTLIFTVNCKINHVYQSAIPLMKHMLRMKPELVLKNVRQQLLQIILRNAVYLFAHHLKNTMVIHAPLNVF